MDHYEIPKFDIYLAILRFRDLFGMVSETMTRTQRMFVTSNHKIKWSRLQSPAIDPFASPGKNPYMCHGQGCRYIGDKLIPPLMTESL